MEFTTSNLRRFLVTAQTRRSEENDLFQDVFAFLCPERKETACS